MKIIDNSGNVKFGEAIVFGDNIFMSEDVDGRITLNAALVSGTANSLIGLGDVAITSPQDDQFLRYTVGTTKWINQFITATDIGPGTFKTGIFVFSHEVDLTTGPLIIGIDLGGSQILRVNGDILARNLYLIGGIGEANGSIEIGRIDGFTSTPFIDFHSGATLVDYDTRIKARAGGTGVTGGGTLEFIGSAFVFGSDPSGNALMRIGGDLRIGSLGVFDSSIAPTIDQVLSFNNTKWVPRTIQLSFISGDVAASNLADGTIASYLAGTPAGGTQGGTPTAPTAQAMYKAIIVTMPTTLPANCVYVLDYSVNGGAYTNNAIITKAAKVVHSSLVLTSTYAYKYLIRGAGDTAYSTASNPITPSSVAEVNAFGIILASQISVGNLASISANIGTITAGFLRDTNSKFNIDLANAKLFVMDNQGSPVNRVNLGKIGAGDDNYGIQVFDKNAATVIDFTGAKRILAIPVQDVGDKSDTFTIDLSTGLTQQVRLTAPTIRMHFTGQVDGGRYRVWFQQDTTGSRTIPIFDDIVMWSADTPPTLSTQPGVFDVIEFEYRANPTARFAGTVLAQNIVLPAPLNDNIIQPVTDALSSSHNVSLFWLGPSGNPPSGQLLILVISTRAGSINHTVTTPSGWTLLGTQLYEGSNVSRASVFVKVSGGSDTSVTITTSVGTVLAAVALAARDWYGSLEGVVIGSFNTGQSTIPDPAPVTPGWTDRTLWLAINSRSIGGVPGYPTNYTQATDAGNNTPSCTIAERRLYAASDDPGTFTLGVTADWAAATIAVRPPA